jgi:hypothetical protein
VGNCGKCAASFKASPEEDITRVRSHSTKQSFPCQFSWNLSTSEVPNGNVKLRSHSLLLVLPIIRILSFYNRHKDLLQLINVHWISTRAFGREKSRDPFVCEGTHKVWNCKCPLLRTFNYCMSYAASQNSNVMLINMSEHTRRGFLSKHIFESEYLLILKLRKKVKTIKRLCRGLLHVADTCNFKYQTSSLNSANLHYDIIS